MSPCPPAPKSNRWPVAFDLLGEHHGRAGMIEDRLQRIAALVELPCAQVMTIEKQEIESVEDRPISRCRAPPLVSECGLQCAPNSERPCSSRTTASPSITAEWVRPTRETEKRPPLAPDLERQGGLAPGSRGRGERHAPRALLERPEIPVHLAFHGGRSGTLTTTGRSGLARGRSPSWRLIATPRGSASPASVPSSSSSC